MYAVIDDTSTRSEPKGTSFLSPSESARTKKFAGLTFAYFCAVGTMGGLTPEMMAQGDATSNSVLQYKHPIKAANSVPEAAAMALQPTAAQDLARIRDVLKPTVLELANLFGVSRQAVYDWQSGSQPNNPQAVVKLAELARAANVFSGAGVVVNTQTLRRKISGGDTLLDAVLNGGDAVKVAQTLVGTLKRESIQREHIAQQLAGRERSPINTSDYGAPSLIENI